MHASLVLHVYGPVRTLMYPPVENALPGQEVPGDVHAEVGHRFRVRAQSPSLVAMVVCHQHRPRGRSKHLRCVFLLFVLFSGGRWSLQRQRQGGHATGRKDRTQVQCTMIPCQI